MNQTQKIILEAFKLMVSINTSTNEELEPPNLEGLETARQILFEILEDEGIEIEEEMTEEEYIRQSGEMADDEIRKGFM